MDTKPSIASALKFSHTGLLLTVLGIPPAWANTLTVNDLGGTTTAADGLCTLPEAINNAEANNDTTGGDCVAGSGSDTINFKVSGNVLSGKLPTISDPNGLTIDGTGQSIILGNGAGVRHSGFFTVSTGGILNLQKLTVFKTSGDTNSGAMHNDGGIVTINGCTFSSNHATYAGAILNGGTLSIVNSLFTGNGATYAAGAIENGGTLSITNSIFSNNGTGGGMYQAQGGAIQNAGTVTITNSTFSSNRAPNGGGGIISEGFAYEGVVKRIANVNLINSTFSDNSAQFDTTLGGGGIYNGKYANLTIINSTFSGNKTSLSHLGGGGGAVHNSGGGTLSVINSSFSGNISTDIAGVNPGGVGGISTDGSGSFKLANTILADNKGGDCQNSSAFTTNLNNLIKDGSCNPMLSGNPRLGSLTNNGGPTQTFVLLTGSPALDAGNDAICKSAPVNSRDQRGVIRPQGAHCDIGAFEAAFADLSVSIVDNPDPVLLHQRLTWTIKATNSGVAKATGVTLTDQLPPSGYKLLSIAPAQGKCNAPTLTGRITCNLGSIANGKNVTVKIVVKPIRVGKLSNTAKVNSNQFDNHLANNSATQVTTVKHRFCKKHDADNHRSYLWENCNSGQD